MTVSHVKKSRPDGAGIQNEEWDDLSLHQHQEAVGAAAADLTPSRVESAVSEEAAATSSPLPLDDYLHNYPSVSDFVLSIPSRRDEMPSDNEHNNEDGSCCNESILSDITEMTYRAELMKEVSRERSHALFVFMFCMHTSNFFFYCIAP